MMVSLCGSPPPGFFPAFMIGLAAAAGFLFYTHYRISKTDYYKEEFVYFSLGKRIILYLSFLMVNLCTIPLLLLICVLIFS
ncbi:hypothetical protein BSF42_24350 [Flavobacterium sp. ACN6]|nr:hypothetical protein BSF42_24350 [Flavobacterium sp. ACN6]